MIKNILRTFCLAILIGSCATSRNSNQTNDNVITTTPADVNLPADRKPSALTDLARTKDGGFILAPGYYETEFKTYCLQPGTPDPHPEDAYLQAPLTGYRKDIVQTALFNSRKMPDIEQKHVQLLLWNVVSGANFNKLSPDVQSDAWRLLTPRQIFELKGGVMGVVNNVTNNLPLGGNNEVRRLFEIGSNSYEAFEKIAVLHETSQIRRSDFKIGQWYKQKENYYVRYFPVSYQKVRVQVYVPDGGLDSTGKINGKYIVFDPTATQVIPAYSNTQRLGIGGPLVDIIRVVIDVNKGNTLPKKGPDNNKTIKKGPGARV